MKIKARWIASIKNQAAASKFQMPCARNIRRRAMIERTEFVAPLAGTDLQTA